MSTTNRWLMPEAAALTATAPVVPRVGHFVRRSARSATGLPAAKGSPALLLDSVPVQPGTGVAAMHEPVQHPGGTLSMQMPMTPQANVTAMMMPQDEHDGLRAGMYGLLSGLLAAPPSAQLLGVLEAIEDAAPVADDLATAWRLLKVAARDSNAEALGDEYHNLFIGIGRGELVPYASWYLTGFLTDRPLAYLRRDLALLGIERQPGSSDPEDHAATLCESMRVIITAEDIGFSRQRHFFLDHIVTWMQVFFQDLQQAQAACLYAAVGGLGEAFLRFEGRYFELEE